MIRSLGSWLGLGFPKTPNKTKNFVVTGFPFGLWFADANTLHVADEGNGDATFSAGTMTYANAAAQTTAGLQKWVFDSAAQMWKLRYTLKAGLNLGIPYTVTNYQTGTNVATGLPWAPATSVAAGPPSRCARASRCQSTPETPPPPDRQ